MNFNTAKTNMLMNQIRTWDFISPEVLAIMEKLQREEFVPVTQRKLAFSDIELPIGNDQHMMKPVVEGRILQSLNLSGTESVLEVGTGSGFMTALLALSSKNVKSVDIYDDFLSSAEEKLKDAKIENFELTKLDIFSESLEEKYDVIVLTGSTKIAPEFLFDSLNENGKIFAIIGTEPVMTASIFTKTKNEISQNELFETVVGPLKTPKKSSEFKL